MPTLKPIETEAFGRLFRSRLEARCAVFLEAMGLRWEYEPEGFELPSGRYLPDFKVYDADKLHGFYWLECKGGKPKDQEVQLAKELCESSLGAPCVVFTSETMEFVRLYYLRGIDGDNYYLPSQACHRYGDDFNSAFFITETLRAGDGNGDLERKLKARFLVFWKSQKAFAAVNQALKARFEHGAGYA
jgi:hypothetical protein